MPHGAPFAHSSRSKKLDPYSPAFPSTRERIASGLRSILMRGPEDGKKQVRGINPACRQASARAFDVMAIYALYQTR